MKHYELAYYILFLSFICISCENDDIAPEVQINSPAINTSFNASETLILDALITDNKELDFVAITLAGPDDGLILRKVELTGDSQGISEEFELDFKSSGMLTMNINAVDMAGNSTSTERNFDFVFIETGSLDLNIKLQYDGEPLVMFDTYAYPDGKNINFTRCSFYTSEMKLDEKTIVDVDFHNLTNSHANPELASNGYSRSILNVPVGNYNTFSFNIGVPEELNNRDPGEFPSGHPLAKPAENWFSWMSYIFLKIEGKINLSANVETGVALHTGSNEALRNIKLEYPIQIKENEVSSINLVFDIYQLFNGTERIFPIEETPQIHSLSQIDAVVELSDNLINSIQKF